jgi:hypothetical protein
MSINYEHFTATGSSVCTPIRFGFWRWRAGTALRTERGIRFGRERAMRYAHQALNDLVAEYQRKA